jgi:glucose-6-phosphate isomerase
MDQWLLPAWLDEAVARRLEALQADRYAERLWEADAKLWKPGDEAHQAIIGNALGWLSVFEGVREQIEGLTEFVDELRGEGYRSAVLLGMGGSSLAPEVLREVLGVREGYLDLHVLDSTDPAAVLAVEAAVDLETTVFVVSSKSGGTTETASFHAYFFERLQELDGHHAGHHFVAITDEGTSLQHEALDQGFRAVFVNPSDIGGRYSALSFFGMVPAALIGADLERLLDGVRAMAVECGPDVPASRNPAVRLGAVLGEAALAGHDKLTIVAEPRLRALGAWVEQLVAESTGKEGRGILPVDLEALGGPEVYGDDRIFANVGLESVAATGIAGQLMDLAAAGHPVHGHEMTDVYGLGGEFLRWEIAVATAGLVLGIDPFDQPNVQESKDNTKRLLASYIAGGELTEDMPEGEGRLAYPVADDGLPAALATFFAQAEPGDYVALQAYVAPGEHVWEDLDALRLYVRDELRLATTLGYGPRFLHSTGQFHKGGPNTGLFLQLLGHDPVDVDIPGQPYSFSVLKRAQARGDLGALRAHGCRALRVCLGDDVTAGVRRLGALVAGALPHRQ